MMDPARKQRGSRLFHLYTFRQNLCGLFIKTGLFRSRITKDVVSAFLETYVLFHNDSYNND